MAKVCSIPYELPYNRPYNHPYNHQSNSHRLRLSQGLRRSDPMR